MDILFSTVMSKIVCGEKPNRNRVKSLSTTSLVGGDAGPDMRYMSWMHVENMVRIPWASALGERKRTMGI
jgi:hypothetical protein